MNTGLNYHKETMSHSPSIKNKSKSTNYLILSIEYNKNGSRKNKSLAPMLK